MHVMGAGEWREKDVFPPAACHSPFHLICDQEYQSSSCQDERHQIFLHQFVLSALLATSLAPERMRVLPSDHGYPYDLHRSVPRQRRAQTLNDLVCYLQRPLLGAGHGV